MVPKVKFQVKPLKEYIDVMYYFLNPGKGDWDWSRGISRAYPSLKTRLEGIKKKGERNKISYEFFKEVEKRNKSKLRDSKLKFQNSWNKINDKALETLSEVVEIDWPKKDKIITANVTLNPICPRWIKERRYDLFYRFKMGTMREVSLHEILHFIYFEKWKQVFPKTKEKEFDGPYLVWDLSEMVPPIILSDKRVQKIVKHKPSVYQEYLNCKIKGKSILLDIKEFYDNRKNFEDFLKQSWKFVNKHKKKIESI